MKYFLVVSYETLMTVLFLLPRYRLLNKLKSSFLRVSGAKIGKNVVFYPGVWIMPARNLMLGDDVDLALGVLITTSGGVEVGDRTLIGYRTQIISGNHKVLGRSKRIIDSGHDYKKITIGKDCWIGANCLILPGVTIGDGAVVAGGSLVTKDVSSYSVVAGSPASEIKVRN